MSCFTIIMIKERKNFDSYRLEFNDVAVNGYCFLENDITAVTQGLF